MTRRFIGELLFAQANVVAVDLSATPTDVPERTQLVIADESMERAAVRLSERFFENADVVVAEELIDGVDIVIILGADFLVLRAEQLEDERRAAAEVGEGEADFDFSTTAETDGSDTTDATNAAADGTVAGDG